MAILTNNEPFEVKQAGEFFLKVSSTSGTVTLQADIDDGKGFEDLTDKDGNVLTFAVPATPLLDMPVCTFRAAISGDNISFTRRV